ncbi:hypothetical protein Tco_0669742 [Tanacetum coccineum]
MPMSSAEAEYVALSASCAQVMWMRTQLQDYGFQLQTKYVVLRTLSKPLQSHATPELYTNYLTSLRKPFLRIGFSILSEGLCKVQEVQSSVISSGDETSSGIVLDEEIEKNELEAHYGFMAKIQEVLPAKSSSMIPLNRSTFANPKYLKIAQSEKPRLYEIPYDTSDPANRFCPNGEETVTLEKESRSKLDKDKVKPYDYTYQNSLYETFKPPSKNLLLIRLERA